MTLRGVMAPAMVGVMTPQRFTVGQRVRFVGKSGTINHGAVGTVEQMHETLTTCPVVRFPGTLGPYSTFTVTRFNDLELVDPR